MQIAGINLSHDGSFCVVEDGEVIYYTEAERWTRQKHGKINHPLFHHQIRQFPKLSGLAVTTQNNLSKTDIIYRHDANVRKLKIYDYQENHHLCHAASAFYGSGFDEAYAVVWDGTGELYPLDRLLVGQTWLSVYRCSYPHRFQLIEKRIWVDSAEKLQENRIHPQLTRTRCCGPGVFFEECSVYLNWDRQSAGKVMGLAAYGKQAFEIPYRIEAKNELIKLFQKGEDADAALTVQTYHESILSEILSKYTDLPLVLGGGSSLNCVANGKLLKDKKDVYIDPICHDGGTAIGAAQLAYHIQTKSSRPKKLQTLFLGPDLKNPPNLKPNCRPEQVAALLTEDKFIALFQGKAEGGPRALGNRSILANPRNVDNKDRLNTIKGRELFRPFGCSILAEHFEDWFETGELKESPYMLYALKVKPEKQNQIPAALHIDKTTRPQTVTEKQNPKLYTLLKAFYDLTGVPLLINTSLNRAGAPLVEDGFHLSELGLSMKLDAYYLADFDVLSANV